MKMVKEVKIVKEVKVVKEVVVVVVVIFYLSDMGEDCLHIVTFYKSWSAQLTPRAIDGL